MILPNSCSSCNSYEVSKSDGEVRSGSKGKRITDKNENEKFILFYLPKAV